MTDSEKMDLQSMDISQEKINKLRELFPEVFTEGRKIDFERLKLTLGEAVDVGKERYGMNWPGKADCFKIIQQPSIATLTPAREESVDFDETENLFIEGDNLEVLKLLQKSYFGKVKVIEIDPPYNTGNDFIYPDNYSESLDTYLRYTGQIDNEGRKYSTNTEADGRFHSKWLNMLYPRLFLARNLLREDGVIFVSIDDKEIENLKRILHEIFGEHNWIGTLVWKNVTDNNPTRIAIEHEYIVAYAKDIAKLTPIWKSSFSEVKDLLIEKGKELIGKYTKDADLQHVYAQWYRVNKQFLGQLDRYRYIDKGGIYTGSQSVHNPGKEGYRYDVIHPATGKPCKQPLMGYRFPEDTMKDMLKKEKILFGEDEDKIIEIKLYADEFEDKLSSLIVLDSRLGSYDLREIFPNIKKIFDNPKPVQLLAHLLDFDLKNGEIVLDFFSGSCTSAHATLHLNREDGGNRKFIMVQLPEPCTPETDAFKAGYKTIADIGKERIRRVIKKIKEEQEQKKDLFSDDKPKLDLGFKVFKLGPSNFKLWNDQVAKEKDAIQNQLEMFVEHINPQSSQEDILYELLLKSGFPLSTKIEQLSFADKSVFSIDEGAMLICLEKDLTPEVIKAMAEKKPSRVICLDEGFHGNDQLKTNAVQIMKSRDINFRTV